MKTDEEFYEALAASYGTVMDVACLLKRKGYKVKLPVPQVRPRYSDWKKYSDEGDIEIRQTVEVKRRDINFTCADDYPFDDIWVDEVYKVTDEKKRDCWAYVLVNKKGTHAAICRMVDQPEWTTGERDCGVNRRSVNNYKCPKRLIWFVPLQVEVVTASNGLQLEFRF